MRLPIREKGISLGRDYYKSETAWRVVIWDEQTRKFYGVEEGASALFSFDPYAGEDGEIRTLGQLCIPGYERRAAHRAWSSCPKAARPTFDRP